MNDDPRISLCRNSDNNARSCISVRTVTIIRLEGRTHRVALIYGRNNNEETRQKAILTQYSFESFVEGRFQTFYVSRRTVVLFLTNCVKHSLLKDSAGRIYRGLG